MHFHLQIPHRTTTRHSKYNVNSIVRLLLKLCPPQKIRVNIPTSRICWWQKRKQSTTAFCSIKTKAFFFKKRHVVFNKTTRHFQQRSFAAQCTPQDGAHQTLSYKTQKNKLFSLHTRAYARICAHITRVLSFLLSHLSHLFAQNS